MPDAPGAVPPSSHELSPEDKRRRSSSFGSAAEHYERYRPGPPPAAVDWLVPEGSTAVVDLGAGTGAMTRLLVERVATVIAIEPDARMREVLHRNVPGARAIEGRGEAMPIPDASVDAVLASSSWHWMEPIPAFRELERVLVPGGRIGAVWAGPDPESPLIVQAQALLAQRPDGVDEPGPAGRTDHAGLTSDLLDPVRREFRLVVPEGAPFSEPEHLAHTWSVELTADDLIGLLGTLSWIILMAEERRARIFEDARRLLRDAMGVEGDVTIEVGFRADAWRSELRE